MKQTVNFYEFRRAFQDIRPDNFSAAGLSALFDYLEQYEQDTGDEIELDVIALCCEFTEDTPEDIAASYNFDIEDCTDGEALDRVIDCLNNNGAFIGSTDSGNIVYRPF